MVFIIYHATGVAIVISAADDVVLANELMLFLMVYVATGVIDFAVTATIVVTICCC